MARAVCVAVCRRAGGGFGGKVTRSMPVAAAAAVAAHKLGRTVHYQQDRNEDFRINGGYPIFNSTSEHTLNTNVGKRGNPQPDVQ